MSGDLLDRIAPLGDLLDCFDLEFFWITFAAHIHPPLIAIFSGFEVSSKLGAIQKEILRKVQISNANNTNSAPEYKWMLVQTEGAQGNIFTIPSGIPGFDFSWLPAGATKVTYTGKFAAETDKERLYRHWLGNSDSEPDMDGATIAQVGMRYDF